MAYSEALAQKIRKSLDHVANVEEKKIFGSLAFIVNGKMCLTAGPERMMCRIGPKMHEEAVKNEGCTTVMMGGRNYLGYIHIQEKYLQKEEDFAQWLSLALEFNKKLTSS
ncbi:MAG: hypothetical protein GC180_12700 [Bacteroidetes bacterium]|nr:hypothetical protein [Bacteroidota bacterium]